MLLEIQFIYFGPDTTDLANPIYDGVRCSSHVGLCCYRLLYHGSPRCRPLCTVHF